MVKFGRNRTLWYRNGKINHTIADIWQKMAVFAKDAIENGKFW